MMNAAHSASPVRPARVQSASAAQPAGHLLRQWRQRRRMSQLELALEAEISTRHLSFVETGRSRPSREMVLHLAERLEVPLRDRNALLIAAGYAPTFAERPLNDPAMEPARKAIDLVLAGHEPYPALALDRHWNLVAANRIAPAMMANADPELLKPPVNVLRLSLHPKGTAAQIANLPEWRAHVFERLRHQIDLTADRVLVDLLQELRGYPAESAASAARGAATSLNARDYGGVVFPLQFVTDAGLLSFFSTTTIFGTPVDITLSELAVESFFPADAATAEAMRQLAAQLAAQV